MNNLFAICIQETGEHPEYNIFSGNISEDDFRIMVEQIITNIGLPSFLDDVYGNFISSLISELESRGLKHLQIPTYEIDTTEMTVPVPHQPPRTIGWKLGIEKKHFPDGSMGI